MLVTCRTAPGHSYVNPAERCTSTLNLALQNCALSREKSSEEAEKRFKPCSGMNAIRSLPPVLHKARAEAVAPVQEVVAKRFNRLMYAEKQVQVHNPATDAEITKLVESARQIDPAIDTTNTALKQGDLNEKQRLKEFIASHCRARHYSFQIRKCGLPDCAFGLCKPPRLPPDVFNSLAWLPDPVVQEASPDHYQPYSAVKGKQTTDQNRPSLQAKGALLQEAEQGCSSAMFTAQRVRSTVQCTKCLKPRCIYSQAALAAQEMAQLHSAL